MSLSPAIPLSYGQRQHKESRHTLGLVQVVGHRYKLWAGEIVGKRLTLSVGPAAGTRDPCLFQRNDMILIEVTSAMGSYLSLEQPLTMSRSLARVVATPS